MPPKHKRKETRDKGTEVSGGPVRRNFHEKEYEDGSKHNTESVTTEHSSGRASWDTDKDGNVSDVHINMNK
jgi:hypothetical protein